MSDEKNKIAAENGFVVITNASGKANKEDAFSVERASIMLEVGKNGKVRISVGYNSGHTRTYDVEGLERSEITTAIAEARRQQADIDMGTQPEKGSHVASLGK